MPLDSAVDVTPIRAENDDYERFGELVEQWSNNPTTVPGTTEEIKEEMSRKGISLPDRIKKIVVIHETDETLHIVCPPPEILAQGKEEVDNPPGQKYPLPDPWYDLQVNERPGRKEPNSRFLLFRVGEYCLGQCR